MASSSSIPTTMRSLAISSYTTPGNYTLMNLPVPVIEYPTDVVIKVHAAALNPGDTKLAAGSFAFMHSAAFPYKLCHDISGTIVALGSSVTGFSLGDDVFTMLPITRGGSASEYSVVSSSRLAKKPRNISHTAAASLPTATITALQALARANTLLPLAGKTVFIPAGLSGTGAAAAQIAKRVYGAGKVVSTVSSAKVGMVEEMLGHGTVDKIVDYTTEDVVAAVGPGSVDVLFDTCGVAFAYLPVVKKGGVVVSITALCKGAEMDRLMPAPWVLKRVLDAAFWVNWLRAWWSGVQFEVCLAVLGEGEMEQVRAWVEEKKVGPVVGKVVKLADLEAVKDVFRVVASGKGGVGKYVIEID